MFGIGFLLVLALALLAIHLLTRLFPPKARPYVWLAVVAFAGTSPFWYHLYPSYREFMALCERPDRYVLLKSVDVDYAYSHSGSFGAYRQNESRGFKGFDVKQGQLGYFRYTRSENWPSSSCQRDCADPSVFVWEKRCEASCLTKIAIPSPEFEYKTTNAITVLEKGRIVQQRSAAVSPSGEELAIALNYAYSPYGVEWAKVLGVASGNAPSLSCQAKKNLDKHEFIRPKAAN